MGPHRLSEKQKPAFMDIMQEEVNKNLPENEKIEHPKPQDEVDKTLFAADMRSLAGPKGAQKILDIRSSVPNFRGEDGGLCEEYKKYGIDLTPGEAALFSAFTSAEQARNSIDKEKDQEGDWGWVNQAVEKAKSKEDYFYGEKDEEVTLNAKDILAKKEKFEQAKEIEEVRHNMGIESNTDND